MVTGRELCRRLERKRLMDLMVIAGPWATMTCKYSRSCQAGQWAKRIDRAVEKLGLDKTNMISYDTNHISKGRTST